MVNTFHKKIVVVTGGAWGIGRSIAAAFAQEGAQVVTSTHTKDHAQSAKKWFASKKLAVQHIHCDLSRNGEAQQFIRQIIKTYGTIDVLVNNAKFVFKTPFLEETDESWDTGIGVSLKAAYFASQEALKTMIRYRSGSVVTISSVTGILAGYDSAVYHIAKAGLIHMTRYLALHAGKSGVRVNCIAPGLIIKDERKEVYEAEENKDYKQRAEFVHPLGRPGTPEEVAKAVLFLASKEASFINGVCLPVDGGLGVQEQNGMVHEYNEKIIFSRSEMLLRFQNRRTDDKKIE